MITLPLRSCNLSRELAKTCPGFFMKLVRLQLKVGVGRQFIKPYKSDKGFQTLPKQCDED